MQKLNIPHLCNEDFSKMTATERGRFCEKCSTDTYAFYNKSTPEIKSILRENIGKEVCGQFAPGQLEAINAEFEAWTFRSKKSFQSAFAMTLLVVFGLGLFSCNDHKQEKEIIDFQKTTKAIVADFQNGIDLSDVAAGLNKTPDKAPIPISIDLSQYVFDCGFAFPFHDNWSMMPGGVIEVPYYMNNWLNVQPAVEIPAEVMDSCQTDSVKPERELEPILEAGTTEGVSVLAFPNPTAGITTLEYKNLEKAKYRIDVLDLNGKHLGEVFSGKIDEKLFRQEVDLSEFTPGIYIVVISSRKFKETTRIIRN